MSGGRPPIRGLVFDFDGLILETEEPDFRAWQEVYAAFGCTLPLAAWAAHIGTAEAAFNPYDELEAQLGRPVDRAALRARRRRRFAELVAGQACARPEHGGTRLGSIDGRRRVPSAALGITGRASLQGNRALHIGQRYYPRASPYVVAGRSGAPTASRPPSTWPPAGSG